MPFILLTNDDGIDAEGLRCLEESLQGLAEVVVVAPDRERSAVSHSLTIHSPLELNKIDANRYTLNGTPADCIIYFLRHLAVALPSLVISGINHGANLGDDIMYSGTVAGAREASRHGIPSLAVSQAIDERQVRFKKGARFVRNLVATILEGGSNGSLCLNINIPVRRIRGVKITRQGCSLHHPHFNSLDRQSGGNPFPEGLESSSKSDFTLDFNAILDHHISITPLQRDQTDYAAAHSLLQEIPRLVPRRRILGIGLIGHGKLS